MLFKRSMLLISHVFNPLSTSFTLLLMMVMWLDWLSLWNEVISVQSENQLIEIWDMLDKGDSVSDAVWELMSLWVTGCVLLDFFKFISVPRRSMSVSEKVCSVQVFSPTVQVLRILFIWQHYSYILDAGANNKHLNAPLSVCFHDCITMQ